MQHPYKNYLVDIGIAHSYTGKLDLGRAIENIVALKLFRKEKEVSYYKSKKSYEVDFVVQSQGRIEEMIQVVYSINNQKIFERKTRALLHAREELNLNKDIPLTVITWDYEDEREVEWWRKKGKIRFVPLGKWLLLYSTP